MKITKNIFIIWIGDNIPLYCKYSYNAYKNINKNFNIYFINITNEILNSIYKNKNIDFKFRNELINSIQFILDKERNKYTNLINTQKQIYGKNIRFIQILSDIFRLELLNTYNGIYVDCDTYPIKQFDNKILNDSFIGCRYYSNQFGLKYYQKYIDNYFIGVSQSNKIYDLINNNALKIIQTNKNFETDIGYIFRKKQFYNNKLYYSAFNIGNDISNFYIEHYHANSWKLNITNISRTPRCIFDKLF